MNGQGVGQILFFIGALIALAYPLGLWMARVYGTFRAPGRLRALEGGFYRVVRTQAGRTLRTEGPTFAALLAGMVVLTSGLTVLPALTLGPIVESLAP